VATRSQRLIVALALAACIALPWLPAPASAQAPPKPPQRIVSLVPALTEMLYAIGGGPLVVGVSSFDEFPPEVKKLPQVGALLNPDVERILVLRPDLVLTYGSQSALEMQLERAGIRTFSYRHGGIATVLDSIRDLGRETGRATDAARVVRDIESRLQAIRERVKGRPRPRALLVFERQPGALRDLYVSGGQGFLHEMLEAAGGTNVFADVQRESVQPSQETLISRGADIIIEVRTAGLLEAGEVRNERNVWSALSALAAVRNNRIHFLSGQYLVVPGPRLAQATEAFARVLHPGAFVEGGKGAGSEGARGPGK
jgi:iron complex transport system substrate-binding protein